MRFCYGSPGAKTFRDLREVFKFQSFSILHSVTNTCQKSSFLIFFSITPFSIFFAQYRSLAENDHKWSTNPYRCHGVFGTRDYAERSFDCVSSDVINSGRYNLSYYGYCLCANSSIPQRSKSSFSFQRQYIGKSRQVTRIQETIGKSRDYRDVIVF